MSNRKERRAQARTKPDTIPLNRPTREAPQAKTLLEIASDRQLLNSSTQASAPSITTTKIHSDGSISETGSVQESLEPDATPYIDVALYTITLTVLHLTLTVLVHHQYATSPPSLPSLFYSSTIVSPTPVFLLILVTLLHPRNAHVATQLLFAVLSIVAGGWLVYASNEDPYMAVMSKAPPLGTLWVWTIVEMKWEWALGCLGVVAAWGWWNGYSMV